MLESLHPQPDPPRSVPQHWGSLPALPCPSLPAGSQGASCQGELPLVLLEVWNAHLGGCRAMEVRSEWLELSRKWGAGGWSTAGETPG